MQRQKDRCFDTPADLSFRKNSVPRDDNALLKLLRLVFSGCLVAVLYLALGPIQQDEIATGWDKTNHLLAFATLGVLGSSAWPDKHLRVFLGLAAYGSAIEALQAFVPGRQAAWQDMLANLAGLLLAWSVLRGLLRFRSRNS